MAVFTTEILSYLSWRNPVNFSLFALFIWLIWRRKAPVEKTKLFYNKSSLLLQVIVSRCKPITEEYVPTYLWGKNGHIQSFIHSVIGRFGGVTNKVGSRQKLTAIDGSIISYDIFDPDLSTKKSMICDGVMILIVPGICNHAEDTYIKAFASYMCKQGFRVAVYNHTGALKSIKLNTPRIFTYGNTSDLEQVTDHILKTKSVNRLIGLGFSLGGNILMKYLGEKPKRQKHFLFAALVCAVFDGPECIELLKQWNNLRRFYNYVMTRNMLEIIKHHQPTLATLCQSTEPPVNLNWKKIMSSKALHELDAEFTMKLYNETNIQRFYQENSSSPYLDKVCIPLLFLNAEDDPIVPKELQKYPERAVQTNENALFIVTPFGGHLGFFEGGYLFANQATWLDRMLSEYSKVALEVFVRR